MKRRNTISIGLSVVLSVLCIVGCTVDVDLDSFLDEEYAEYASVNEFMSDQVLEQGSEDMSKLLQSESRAATAQGFQEDTHSASEAYNQESTGETKEPKSQPETEKMSQTESQPVTEKETQKASQSATEGATQKASQPATEKATQKETQPATQPATQAPTEPPTQAPTEPPTEPITEAPVQPATQEETTAMVSPDTPAETVPPEEPTADNELENRIAANMDTYAEFIQEVVRLTNEQREQYGHPALAYDETLTKVAMYRSIECADNNLFSHTRPDGTNFGTVLEYYGVQFTFAAENIARGHTSPEMVMEGWLRSDGHRANIVSEKYTSIGIGISIDSKGRLFWTQIFMG